MCLPQCVLVEREEVLWLQEKEVLWLRSEVRMKRFCVRRVSENHNKRAHERGMATTAKLGTEWKTMETSRHGAGREADRLGECCTELQMRGLLTLTIAVNAVMCV